MKKTNRIFLKKKPPTPRVFETLTNAISEDGNVMFSVDDTVVLRRDHRLDRMISICTVTKISSTSIDLFDETLGQWFIFDLSNPPTLKLTSVKTNVVVGKKSDDDIPMNEECLFRASSTDERKQTNKVSLDVEKPTT